jgi:hypothetical protein
MEGYDVTLLSSFYGYPSFRERYGEFLNEKNGYQISATWQQRFNCLGAMANILGALTNGWACARWGHRRVLIFFYIWLSGMIFITVPLPPSSLLPYWAVSGVVGVCLGSWCSSSTWTPRDKQLARQTPTTPDTAVKGKY